MDAAFVTLIADLRENHEQPGVDGRLHRIDAVTRIAADQGEYLHRFVLEQDAARTLEIGMAYGFSTLYFLAAHAARGRTGLCHTAVDPFERSAWHGIGLVKVEQSGRGDLFRLIEQPSIAALPPLRAAGERFDLVFIDGDHKFDSVILDLHLGLPLCTVGGHVILDDMWMGSVGCAARFALANLPFERVPQPHENLLVMRKVAEDERPWDHFVSFLEPPPEPRWRRRLRKALGRDPARER